MWQKLLDTLYREISCWKQELTCLWLCLTYSVLPLGYDDKVDEGIIIELDFSTPTYAKVKILYEGNRDKICVVDCNNDRVEVRGRPVTADLQDLNRWVRFCNLFVLSCIIKAHTLYPSTLPKNNAWGSIAKNSPFNNKRIIPFKRINFYNRPQGKVWIWNF